MSNQARFWNGFAARYARHPISDQAAYDHKLALTQSHMRPDMDLLEIGCGTGGTAVAHAAHVRHITAVDFSAEMLGFARTKAAEAGATNITFREAALDEIDPAEKTYDMVLMLSVLHLIADRTAAAHHVWNLLKPGGLFVSSTVCLTDYPRLARLIVPVASALRQLPAIKIFSPDALRATLTGAGFDIIEDWRPKPAAPLFLIAQKPEGAA